MDLMEPTTKSDNQAQFWLLSGQPDTVSNGSYHSTLSQYTLEGKLLVQNRYILKGNGWYTGEYCESKEASWLEFYNDDTNKDYLCQLSADGSKLLSAYKIPTSCDFETVVNGKVILYDSSDYDAID